VVVFHARGRHKHLHADAAGEDRLADLLVCLGGRQQLRRAIPSLRDEQLARRRHNSRAPLLRAHRGWLGVVAGAAFDDALEEQDELARPSRAAAHGAKKSFDQPARVSM